MKTQDYNLMLFVHIPKTAGMTMWTIDNLDFYFEQAISKFQKLNQCYKKLVRSGQLQANVWDNLPSSLN